MSIVSSTFNSMAYTLVLSVFWSFWGFFFTLVAFAEFSTKSGFIVGGFFGFVLLVLIKIMINEYRAGDTSIDPFNPHAKYD